MHKKMQYLDLNYATNTRIYHLIFFTDIYALLLFFTFLMLLKRTFGLLSELKIFSSWPSKGSDWILDITW